MEVYVFNNKMDWAFNKVLCQNDIRPLIIIGIQNEIDGKVDTMVNAQNLTTDAVISILKSALRKYQAIEHNLPF